MAAFTNPCLYAVVDLSDVKYCTDLHCVKNAMSALFTVTVAASDDGGTALRNGGEWLPAPSRGLLAKAKVRTKWAGLMTVMQSVASHASESSDAHIVDPQRL